MMARASFSERFEDYISPEPNSGCWLWDGGNVKTQKGYYPIGVNGKTKQVHRFADLLLISRSYVPHHVPQFLFSSCLLARCS